MYAQMINNNNNNNGKQRVSIIFGQRINQPANVASSSKLIILHQRLVVTLKIVGNGKGKERLDSKGYQNKTREKKAPAGAGMILSI